MSNTNTGGPAFPVHPSLRAGAYGEGMTLRDYFAAKAMQGLLSAGMKPTTFCLYDDGAETAYKIADTMLEARES